MLALCITACNAKLAQLTHTGVTGNYVVLTVQVHEKSIMLALLPASLLAFEDPALAGWLPVWGTLGMFPLLRKDGLEIAYIACLLLWLCIAPPPEGLVMDSPADAVNKDHSQQQVQLRRTERAVKKSEECWGKSGMAFRGFCTYSQTAAVLAATCIHLAQCCLDPPARFPFLYDAAYVSLAYVQICGMMLRSNWKQWASTRQDVDWAGKIVKQS